MSWIREHHFAAAALTSLLLVALIGLTTGNTPPTSDSLHYLNVAAAGLLQNPGLAAPYAYRFGTPVIVRGIHLVTGLGVPGTFQAVAFLSAWALLCAAYLLARSAGGTLSTGFAAMGVIAFSFFNVKFSLAVPTMVDAQGFLLITLAFWSLLTGRSGLCLLLSCAGLFFKEFLIIPGTLIIFDRLRTYRNRGGTAPLVWAVSTLCLLVLCFIVPRIAIPVVEGYGANFRWNFTTPSHWAYFEHLRYFLAGRPDGWRPVNICFAMASYWLPVLVLATPQRMKHVWVILSPLRSLCILHITLVVILALFGGTNIMIFVAYTLPVLVLVLVTILGTPVHPAEIGVMLLVVLVYNRIPGATGGPHSTIDDIVRFYGGWWSRIDMVTLSRTLEMCGYILLLTLLRSLTGTRYMKRIRTIHDRSPSDEVENGRQ